MTVMRRLFALVLLLIAVACSPAGVCMIRGLAAASPAAAHGHACCASAKRTVIVASEASCCSMPRAGFVNVARFMLETQPATMAVESRLVPSAAARLVARHAVPIRPPLVLRI